jgi:hypothetical protein
MIKDVRAQADLIAELHLDGLFKMGCLDNAGDQSKRVTRSVTAIPHSTEYDSLQIRHRLEVVHTLAVRARGLTVKSDMAQDASTRRNDIVSSQSPANAVAEEDTLRRSVGVVINEGGHSST